MAGESILLEMNHVKKEFDGEGVLTDISLKVCKGEVVSIIGPSGSGKSTLLRCATMLEKMDGGELIYLGERLHGRVKIKREILSAFMPPRRSLRS